VSIPLCTPEQRAVLRTLRAAKFSQRGRSSSVGTKDRVISALEHELILGSPCKKAKMSYDAVVKRVGAREHISPLKLRLWQASSKRRGAKGRSSAAHHARGPASHALLHAGATSGGGEVFDWIAAAREEGTYTFVSLLRAELKQQIQLEVPREALRRWLHGMQIDYGKRKLSSLPIAYRNVYTSCLIRRYLVEYATGEGEQIVLVWMDESYIHAEYCAVRGWFLNSDKA